MSPLPLPSPSSPAPGSPTSSLLLASPGIAVNALGHGDPTWLSALTAQAGQLSHTSNLFHTVPQVELAKRLVDNSFADKAFFCNSGTEANEGAIKFARKYARVAAGVDPYDPAVRLSHILDGLVVMLVPPFRV